MGLMKNTVRLIAEFSTFDGVLTDPSGSIVLSIAEQSSGSFLSTSGSIVRTSLGTYYYDFTIPVGIGNLIYEWSATLEGSPIVNRGILSREWLRI